MQARGDYIGGRFHEPVGEPFQSHDPAHDHAVVLEAAGSAARVAEATEAAAEAQPAWAARSLEERFEALRRFRAALAARGDGLAEAIRREMGKIHGEAGVEIGALLGRFALVEGQVRRELSGGALEGHPDEIVRYQPHGEIGRASCRERV
jgi:acyl-CoA reductase-like NAD-dependent aldehyde dehydrogenase